MIDQIIQNQKQLKKGNKYEINELNDRLLFYDENEKDLNFKMDTIQQYNEKARGDMQQIIKNRIFIRRIKSFGK